ncbi:helix-turn-helix transcriptional regulator [Mesobacillus maritimus]|uniref:helix-turn-helix transcriptional regulator n=1 Tax=Mesobacillus maritimus TaxID=1643336 RepID=UPI0038506734
METTHSPRDLHKICATIHTLSKMDVRMIDQEGNSVVNLVNLYLPKIIHTGNEDYNRINYVLHQNHHHTYHYYVNSFGLEYIATGIWKQGQFNGSIVVGPFISSTSVMEFIRTTITKNQLPISQRAQLESFYKSLPIIPSQENEALGEILVTLCQQGFLKATRVTGEIVKPVINKEQINAKITENKHLIEQRYELEKKIMDAITKGDKKAVMEYNQEADDLLDFSNRIPESPIRSAKNISLVLNTLCRTAAEKGGVHPIYLHHLSEKFAILIERAPNLNKLNTLGKLMANEYCDLVHEFSTSAYHPIVKKAVDYIQFNLETPLTLNQIADAIHVNPTHLSRKFKEETGKTPIEYIHHKRIEAAKLYLYRGNQTITDIAFLVGFNDVNYFTRVFKKITGVTPTQYMKK